jgi:bifunctional DNA-binding transcriptional regulator/antitoxin component of YhaV-PrlF toxin-antitoxin module
MLRFSSFPIPLSLTDLSGIPKGMASTITTVTAKMQVTIPEEVRRIFPVQAGSRLAWSVEGETLVARRVRGVSELRGCLKSEVAFPGIDGEKAAVAANRDSHYATKHRGG